MSDDYEEDYAVEAGPAGDPRWGRHGLRTRRAFGQYQLVFMEAPLAVVRPGAPSIFAGEPDVPTEWLLAEQLMCHTPAVAGHVGAWARKFDTTSLPGERTAPFADRLAAHLGPAGGHGGADGNNGCSSRRVLAGQGRPRTPSPCIAPGNGPHGRA